MPDDKRRENETARPEPDDTTGTGARGRDFGDSAGYGTGGSALDRREVGDDADRPAKPNPLDKVVKTPRP